MRGLAPFLAVSMIALFAVWWGSRDGGRAERGELRLADAGTGTLQGQVLGADGEPHGGIVVRVLLLRGNDPVEIETRTDKSGRYRFASLTPGSWLVEWGPIDEAVAAAELKRKLGDNADETMLADPVNWLRLANILGNPHVVDIKAGQVSTHDIDLPRKRCTQFVVTMGGEPLRGAILRVTRLDEDGRPGLGNPGTTTPDTDAAGKTTLESFHDGPHALTVLAGGWTVGLGTRQFVAATPDQISLDLGSRSLRLEVRDDTEAPVSRCRIAVSGENGREYVSCEDCAAEGGVYEIPFLRDGTHEVFVAVGTTNAPVRTVRVSADSAATTQQIYIAATGGVLVRVQDREKRPLKGIHVRVRHSKGLPAIAGDTDERGEFRVEDLAPGEWEVLVQRVRLVLDESKPHEKSTVKVKAHEETVVDVTLK